MSRASNSTESFAALGCPKCHESLVHDAGRFVCSRHGNIGTSSESGILEFDAAGDYWGEVERDEMQRINAIARNDGWRTAIDRCLRPLQPQLVEYVQDETRADWRVLLPLDRERTTTVDVGAGWGAVSSGIAPHVRTHYAVEKIPERIEFVALRAAQDNIDSIVPVRADLHALPFAHASIDVFLVNGVLEWAGLVDPDRQPGQQPRTPRALQESFLSQLHTLLRPGGTLYVGIENRFGRMFWRGAPDHQGLRYTSLMPRAMASAYMRLRAARSPRTFAHEREYRAYTYSLNGYLRLFESCGFDDVQSYAVTPGYNTPTMIVPLQAPGPLAYLAARVDSPRRARGRLRRLWRRAAAELGIEKRITSCYVFVMRRGMSREESS